MNTAAAIDSPPRSGILTRSATSGQNTWRDPAFSPSVHRFDVALVVAALAGTATLTAIVALDEPAVVPLTDVSAFEGARVAVEGRVVETHAGARGSAIIIAARSLRITALLSETEDLPPRGAEVRIVGVVNRDRGAFTLSTRAADVHVLASPTASVTVSDILAEPARYSSTPVAVVGDIQRGSGGEWHVADPHGRGSILARFARSPTPGWSHVTGELAYEPREARYVLEVTDWRLT